MNSWSRTMPGETESEPASSTDPDQGLYLYGITESAPGRPEREAGRRGIGIEGHDVTTEVIGGLAAVVSPVSLSNYSPEVLSEHATDMEWLEDMVRGHNDVINAIHAEQPILPAKFGSVYAGLPDLQRALGPVEHELREQLDIVRETDEWAVHVYANRTSVAEEVAARDPDIRDLKSQLTDARPGRAFFLQRKLADELSSATDGALDRVAQEVHDRLAAYAVDSSLSPPAPTSHRQTDSVEILRAAYLVPRERTQRFLEEVGKPASDWAGVRAEYTGPWPPYSFVIGVVGEAK